MIDWEKQWELFAENFHDGKAHIDLSRFGKNKTLLLYPGAGFGDLSHPTTHLMLEMMQNRIRGESIVDIGTGSGILSLAALLLGASHAIGIDIDPEAIAHAQKNSYLNNLEGQSQFLLNCPQNLPPSVFLMNMIYPEQREVNPTQFIPHAKLWIVSGILKQQKETYLKQTRAWNWTPLEERQRGEWLSWTFILVPPQFF